MSTPEPNTFLLPVPVLRFLAAYTPSNTPSPHLNALSNALISLPEQADANPSYGTLSLDALASGELLAVLIRAVEDLNDGDCTSPDPKTINTETLAAAANAVATKLGRTQAPFPGAQDGLHKPFNVQVAYRDADGTLEHVHSLFEGCSQEAVAAQFGALFDAALEHNRSLSLGDKEGTTRILPARAIASISVARA